MTKEPVKRVMVIGYNLCAMEFCSGCSDSCFIKLETGISCNTSQQTGEALGRTISSGSQKMNLTVKVLMMTTYTGFNSILSIAVGTFVHEVHME